MMRGWALFMYLMKPHAKKSEISEAFQMREYHCLNEGKSRGNRVPISRETVHKATK